MAGVKSSTIKKILRKKINSWLESITDKKVKELATRDTIVTGGAIASLLQGDKPNDYDVYFATEETALAVANYYVSVFNATSLVYTSIAAKAKPVVLRKELSNIRGELENRILFYMKSAGIAGEDQKEYTYTEYQPAATEEFMDSVFSESAVDVFVQDNPMEVAEDIVKVLDKSEPYRPVYFSNNAVTLTGKMQIVIRFYGSPEEIHDSYDFAHCMCHYRHLNGELVLPQEALESLLSKSLIYRGSLYPVASVIRIRKFLSRGWRITAGQILKILMQISKIDLEDMDTLREQLIGVDQAYMIELMSALEVEGKRVIVDETYLGKLIDNIFE
jgi:hypothetical protein